MMKKAKLKEMIRAIAALALVAALCGTATAADEPAAARLPLGTEIIVGFDSVRNLYDRLSIKPDAVLGQPVSASDLAELKESLGFNPLDTAALAERGVDVTRPLGMGLNDLKLDAQGENHAMDLVLYIPVSDGAKAAAALRAWVTRESPKMVWGEAGPLTTFKDVEEGVTGYMLEKDGFLYVGFNPKGDAKGYMERIAGTPDTMVKSKGYADVAGPLPAGRSVFFYADLKKIVTENEAAIRRMGQAPQPDEAGAAGEGQAGEGQEDDPTPAPMPGAGINMGTNLEFMKQCRAFGGVIDFAGSDLTALSRVAMEPNSDFLGITQDIRFSRDIPLGIPDPPVLLLTFAVNATKYYDLTRKTLAEDNRAKLDQTIAGFKDAYGIDLKTDLIDNLAGNINLGMYDGMTINMMNYNTLLTLSLRDGRKMTEALDRFVAKLPPEQQSMVIKTPMGDHDAYMISVMGMMQIFAGVKGNTLVISLGKPMYDKAMAADPAKGYLATMADRALFEALKADHYSVFYLNAQELFKAVRNFSAMLQQFSDDPAKPVIDETIAWAVGQFDYLLSTASREGDSFTSAATLKTNFSEPFFKGVVKVIERLKEREAARAPREEAPSEGPVKKQ